MDTLELIRDGKLGAALDALQGQVRKDASNAKYRIFLFQLLSVMGQWKRALTQLNVAGEPARADSARASAFEQAPAIGGSIDGQRFAWLADADQRLGPVIEAIVNGRYFWIPMQRISRIEFDPPVDLRDTVWMPASFTWTNGASTVGLVPTRYNDTAAAAGADEALLMARRTEWTDDGRGLGQRMLVTDAGEFALMDVRVIEFDPSADPRDG